MPLKILQFVTLVVLCLLGCDRSRTFDAQGANGVSEGERKKDDEAGKVTKAVAHRGGQRVSEEPAPATQTAELKGRSPGSRGLEPGSFRVDPKTGKIEVGKREYAHADAAKVLKLVIIDWMTNPKVKDYAYGYLHDPANGKRPKPKLERLLIDQRYVPNGFELKIPDVNVELFDRSERDLKQGEMCIRVDRFELKKEGTIEVEFLHAGYGFLGGSFITYSAKKEEGKWIVEFPEVNRDVLGHGPSLPMTVQSPEMGELMADIDPPLGYSKSAQWRALPWQAIAALPLLLFAPVTMCMCGHMNWFSFPFTLSAASLGWWGFARRDRPNIWRIIVLVVAVLASLAVTKNIADILWFGHDPLLRDAA